MKMFILIISFSSLLFSISCENSSTPNEYFECKVNSLEWKPKFKADPYGGSTSKLESYFTDTIFGVIARNMETLESFNLAIIDKGNIKETTYSLNINFIDCNGVCNGANFNSMFGIGVYYTDSLHTGILNIDEIDKLKKVIKGTFSFIGYDKDKNKSVNITDGEFKVKYE